MAKVLRTVALVVLAIVAAASVVYLQYRFDAGDRKSALRIVDEYHAPTTRRSIPDVLRARHPQAAAIGFRAITESSCFQHVRVSAVVQEPDPGAPATVRTVVYDFLVDINRARIVPGNDLGRVAIEELDAPMAFSATAGAASAPAPTSASSPAVPGTSTPVAPAPSSALPPSATAITPTVGR